MLQSRTSPSSVQLSPCPTAQRICNANKNQIQRHPLSLQLGTSTPSIHLGTEHILILVCSECSWQQLRNYGVLSRHLTPHLQSFVVLIVCPRPRPHPPHHVCPSVRPSSQPACLPFCLSRPAFFRASAARSANSLCTSVLAAFYRGSLNVSLSSCSVCCILLCPLSSTRTIREEKAGNLTLCRL